MQKTFYFPHDYNARTDIKIKKLIYDLGYVGYGLFWAIIEDLYNNTNVLELNYDRISDELKSDQETIKKVINDYGLFKIKGKIFYSESVKARLEERELKSSKARDSISYRWHNNNTDVIRHESNRNTIKESKGKENKGNNKKEIDKEKIGFRIPEFSEVKDFFIEKKSSEFEAEKFQNFYQSKNWMVGKNKMKDWRAAASGWISRNKQGFSKPEIPVKSKTKIQDENIAKGLENFLNKQKLQDADIPKLEAGAVHG